MLCGYSIIVDAGNIDLLRRPLNTIKQYSDDISRIAFKSFSSVSFFPFNAEHEIGVESCSTFSQIFCYCGSLLRNCVPVVLTGIHY